MNTIWKFVIPSTRCEVEMPYDSDILSAQVQDEQVVVWARTTTQTRPTKRRFSILMTGEDFPYRDFLRSDFIGTVQLRGGAVVGHVFVEKREFA
ncbi:hypothetical protein HMPREF9946_03129 [Acetobacteraceae bacterium AT-5844]|nr:hypothetical protein HMPREF9946_03129 [Acetobacteraceae bacterium AT-5844]